MSSPSMVTNPTNIPAYRRVPQSAFRLGVQFQQWLWSWTTVIVAEVLVRLRRSGPATYRS